MILQERMQELERKEIEMELEDRRRMEIKKNLINDAAKKQDEPVDDSKLVEAMFDFLPDSSSEAPTPARETSVFNVGYSFKTLSFLNSAMYIVHKNVCVVWIFRIFQLLKLISKKLLVQFKLLRKMRKTYPNLSSKSLQLRTSRVILHISTLGNH